MRLQERDLQNIRMIDPRNSSEESRREARESEADRRENAQHYDGPDATFVRTHDPFSGYDDGRGSEHEEG